jgi:Icc-related predicted phosphoesterase
MKLAALNDLHLDYLSGMERKLFYHKLQEWKAANKDCNIVLLAGDVSEIDSYHYIEILKELNDTFEYKIYITGNHEYCKNTIKDGDETIIHIVSTYLENFHFLNNSEATIAGQRFIGGTGFYPDCKNDYLKRNFYDYRVIRKPEPSVYESNQAFKDILATATPNDIVLSHHAPSYDSVHKDFENSITNCFFVNDIEDIVKEKQPKLFLHGHMHNKFDYKLGNTRVYCNPLGYKNENRNPDFWNSILIEV